jgi:membrane carboxypeptidase/penicillin-binding protein
MAVLCIAKDLPMRLKKILSLVALSACLAMVVYYAWALVDARYIKGRSYVESVLESPGMVLKASDLSPGKFKILLTVQDPGFMTHNGVDFTTPGNGWTTLTQSVCKFIYFENFKPGIRKIKQTLLARYALNDLASKEEQITIYLNVLWFDDNVRGFAAAARHFYGKPFSELSDDEFTALMAMVSLPRNLNPKTHPQANAERVRRIKAVLDGRYKPQGLFDIWYDGA